jgi:hypothetical protein
MELDFYIRYRAKFRALKNKGQTLPLKGYREGGTN